MIKEDDKQTILNLRIKHKYTYSQLIKQFNGRYAYADFKNFFDEVELIAKRKDEFIR